MRHAIGWDLYVSISGLGSYAISNRFTLSHVLGVDLADPARMGRRAEHAANMVISYLCDVKAGGSQACGEGNRDLRVSAQ